MIDTHCHLTFRCFEGRVDEVVQAARDAGVTRMITVTTTCQNAKDNLAVAEQFDGVWCTAGVHPLHSDEPLDWPALRAVAERDECVAFGELGLDDHYDEPDRAIQRSVLEEQIAFVEGCIRDGLDMPVVVHSRKAVPELLDIFRSSTLDPSRFVFHCFTEPPELAKQVIDFGAWISLTGVVTFKGAPEVAEASDLIPIDRLMVETDAPFLAPAPHRKVWPNEPKYVTHVAAFLADRRGIDRAAFETQLDENATRFFGLT